MAVPLPPLDKRVNLANPRHRYYLTGGLPPPSVQRDGHNECMACGGRVAMLLIDTHVPGAWPTRMMERHHCSQKVGA